MKKAKRITKILLGCLLIAVTLNIFYLGTNIIPSGMFGFGIIYNQKFGMNLGLIVLFTNIFFFVLSYLFVNYKSMKKMLLPFIAIPILIFITNPLNQIIDLKEVDKMLISLYGGVLMGLGFRLIYKEGSYASGSDVIMLVTGLINKSKRNIVNYAIDFIWIIFGIFMYGFEGAMYSLISITIMEVLSRRATLGVSDAKIFYIITKCDREVKDYIIKELGYELTIFDVKGGFLKTKNKVLMTVIPTKDYYKLREGVKVIDPNAFISITDSYEVINPNKSLKMTKENI